MLEKQQKLLAAIQAAEREALGIYNSGVKISGVVQKLRDAGKELGERVRSLQREEKPKAAKPPKLPPRHEGSERTEGTLSETS